MRNIVAALLIACSAIADADAQDLSVIGIASPVSSCLGSGIENVTIRLFNYGATLPAGSAFNVAYTIDAGAPVAELVVLGSNLLTNSLFTYTFTTQADVSIPGAHVLNATVALPGDINPGNDAYGGWTVTTWAQSVGGTASGPAAPVLDGAVTLTGQVGDVIAWQQSEDGGMRWRSLANADASLPFAMLYRDTVFRAQVRNGPCASALSNTVLVRSSDPIFHSGFEP